MDIPIRKDFPRQVRTIPTEWITLADGTRLAATIWLPDDALDAPVPAILEYLPYRRRDGTVLRDRQMHAYFAGPRLCRRPRRHARLRRFGRFALG